METHRFSGIVRSGNGLLAHPIAGAAVTVYDATSAAPRAVGSATTDGSGQFSFHQPDPVADGVFYATADAGGGVVLAAVIGPEYTGAVVLNELTTVATGFAMAQLLDASNGIRGNALALAGAAGMSANLVSVLTGEPGDVMLQAPNAGQTTALRSLRSLGNLLVPAVRGEGGENGAWGTLRSLTTVGKNPPANTLQAVRSICLNPINNLAQLYTASQSGHAYEPPLTEQPDAWTLAVKVNATGGHEKYSMFGGPANIAFDRNGYAWIANNVFQGTPNSCDFVVVLQPNGKPADGTGPSGAVSPVVGGGLNGPGWGITIDHNQVVWVGSFGWGQKGTDAIPSEGVVSGFGPSGAPVSGSAGFTTGTERIQAVEVDGRNNLWQASFGNDALVVYLADPPGAQPSEKRVAVYPPPANPNGKAPGVGTFGIAITPDGDAAYVTYSGGLGWPLKRRGHLARFHLEGRALVLDWSMELGRILKVVKCDSQGNAWVASGADNTVYVVSPDGQQVSGFAGGGVNGPWGLAIDGDDDVWVGNFGDMGLKDVYSTGAISRLAGVSSPTGKPLGAAISPDSGYTLKSAGDPVTLPGGAVLLDDGEPCMYPLMRQTSVAIDQAGNVWAVNNWKPTFRSDFSPTEGDPGGDGVVIFVGLAKPPRA